MAKFLLVIAVFIVVYLLIRNHARRAGQSPPAPSTRHGAAKPGEDMVRCAVCGVHLPTSEAVTSRGDFFCSKEHLQLANREGR